MATGAAYAALGPGYVLDDWFALANAHFDGRWMAAGRDQWLARPGAGVVYAVVFGLVGEHPNVAFALSLTLVAAAALLLRRLLLDVGVDDRVAFAVPAVWLVLPNHGSLLFWPSAANVTASLVLLLAGLRALARMDSGTRWFGRAELLLAASVLCYEATAPAAVAGLFVVPRLATGFWQWRRALPGLAALAVVGGWMAVHFHPAKRAVDRWADFSPLLDAHAGWGVVSPERLADVAALTFAVGVTVLIVRGAGTARWLAASGLATIALGTLPFARYFYWPLGSGDRVNVVASVGAAMTWTGLGLVVWQRTRLIAAVATAVLVAGAGLATLESSLAWAGSADDGREWLARTVPNVRDGAIVAIDLDLPATRRNVAPFLDRSNWQSAIQLRTGSRERLRVESRLPPDRGRAP